MEIYTTIILVAIGGAFGAIVRGAFSAWFNPIDPKKIPTGTLITNFLSCVLLGFLITSNLSPIFQILLITGFLGAFSTFSTIMWECTRFQKNSKLTLIYLILTFGAGFLGFEIGKKIFIEFGIIFS